MHILEEALEEIMISHDKILIKAEKLIRATCELSKKNKNYIKLYNEITAEHSESFQRPPCSVDLSFFKILYPCTNQKKSFCASSTNPSVSFQKRIKITLNYIMK